MCFYIPQMEEVYSGAFVPSASNRVTFSKLITLLLNRCSSVELIEFENARFWRSEYIVILMQSLGSVIREVAFTNVQCYVEFE